MSITVFSDRLYDYIAVASSSFVLLTWILAMLIDTKWIFGRNFYSDLGISKIPATRYLFNYGCIIGGILYIMYGVMMITQYGWEPKSIIWAIGILMGVSFAMTGVVDEHNLRQHRMFAWGVFITAASLICAMLIDNMFNKEFIPAAICLIALSFCLFLRIKRRKQYAESIAGIILLVVLIMEYAIFSGAISFVWMTSFMILPI